MVMTVVCVWQTLLMEYAFLLQEGGLLYAITDGTSVFLSSQS